MLKFLLTTLFFFLKIINKIYNIFRNNIEILILINKYVFLVNFKNFVFLMLNKLEFCSFFDKLKKIISLMKKNQIYCNREII